MSLWPKKVTTFEGAVVPDHMVDAFKYAAIDQARVVTATEMKAKKDEHDRAIYEMMKNYPGLVDPQKMANVLASQIRDNMSGIGSSDTSPMALGKMIDMRLRTPPGKYLFEFMMCHKAKDDNKVVVFLYHNKQATHLEDDWNLFPSDTLITQLRLMLG
jgi:hypothetical protein